MRRLTEVVVSPWFIETGKEDVAAVRDKEEEVPFP